MGMSTGPIPITAIYEYCDRERLDQDTRENLFHHVRAMDMAFLEHCQKLNAKK